MIITAYNNTLLILSQQIQIQNLSEQKQCFNMYLEF
jgi:hypothetical protein